MVYHQILSIRFTLKSIILMGECPTSKIYTLSQTFFKNNTHSKKQQQDSAEFSVSQFPSNQQQQKIKLPY